MSTVGEFERQVLELEGIRVKLVHPSGRKVRKDKDGLPPYKYERAARSSWTVKTWLRHRIRGSRNGFAVEVLDGRGDPVWGNTLLSTVRATYEQ